MSFYLVPSHESHYHQRPSSSDLGRCGAASSALPVDPFLDANAIRRSVFGALLADNDSDEEEAGFLGAWHHRQQHLRRQEYLREAERRQRILQARQQQQLLLEQERQRERARRERAARLAWHREQQERAALEYQRRVEAYQRRQQQEYAERVRQAKIHRGEWEQVATQALFGMIDLASQFFGDEKKEVATTSKPAQQPAQEKAAEGGHQETEADKMQVDAQESGSNAEEAQQQPAEEAKDAHEVAEHLTDTNERLLFTYPLPQDESLRSSIRAENIQVSFDAPSRTIQLNGLWPKDSSSDSASSTTVGSGQGGESRGRKRSRSPKKSRVSDVDETTGEEITRQADEEEYVEVAKQDPITKTLRLPETANVETVRAEITDDGFQVWVR